MLFFLVTFTGVFCDSKYDFFELSLVPSFTLFSKIALSHSSMLFLIPAILLFPLQFFPDQSRYIYIYDYGFSVIIYFV